MVCEFCGHDRQPIGEVTVKAAFQEPNSVIA
jgi:hypothetical protein